MPKRLTRADFDEIARMRGGLCIHPHLPKRLEKVRWQCAAGHQFAIRQDNVKAGAWCSICRGTRRPWNMKRLETEMQGRDIRCVSSPDNVNGIQSRLTWECEYGHRWEATIANITHRKSGCPYCTCKAEGWCREVFEGFFDAPFPKVRASWLGGLELDGFSNERLTAFEYQGAHHFKEVTHFKIDASKLLRIQERDRFKIQLCREHFISLYAIRHHPRDCNRKDDFQAYVESELVTQLLREKELLEQGRHWIQKRMQFILKHKNGG